jgi:hypothetical protein
VQCQETEGYRFSQAFHSRTANTGDRCIPLWKSLNRPGRRWFVQYDLPYLGISRRHKGTEGDWRLANHTSISESPCPPCLCEMLLSSAGAEMVRPSMACPTWGSHGGTKAQREFGRLANHISISESPCPPCLCEMPFFGRGGRGSSSMTCPTWGSHGGTKAQREIGRLANHISISESPCPPCLCEMLFFGREQETGEWRRGKDH